MNPAEKSPIPPILPIPLPPLPHPLPHPSPEPLEMAPETAPDASQAPAGDPTPSNSLATPPPHAMMPKEVSKDVPKNGLHPNPNPNPNPNPKHKDRGRRSVFDNMDPILAKIIDNELLSGFYSIKTLTKKYSPLTHHQLLWRQRTLHQAAGRGKYGALVNRAEEAMDWASERTKEVYTIASEKKTPVFDANGSPLMTTIEQMGKEIQTVMEIETPDLPTMLEAVKQMHALARSFGEFEQRIGKIAELKTQKELGIGMGPQQGVGGWGGVGQLNVLVMPKEAGVGMGGPMPKFALPAPPEPQNQPNPDPMEEDFPSGDPDDE